MSLLNEFAIQLYSVRDETEKDFIGTLEKLGKNGLGYTGVEFAGFGGISSDEMKKTLADNGLKAIGSHTMTDRLLENLDEEIAYHKAIGAEYIICPYEEIKTKADVLALAKKLTPVAGKIKAAGLKFGYHNHAHEFVKDEGEYLLDILFDNLPAGTVMELDIFWSEYADVDSLAYMEKHKNRLEILHVKQIGENKKNVELNKGFIDFGDVIKKAKAMGVKHFVLEQEEYETSSMTSVENAIRYIKSL
ncbi:MAG: sugar phosphate isomerase/epimerase [Oscillospiraceae bacterium]|nr:sugar phosphate isomerase/epimerase [Oscillospiraceae bacterium]